MIAECCLPVAVAVHPDHGRGSVPVALFAVCSRLSANELIEFMADVCGRHASELGRAVPAAYANILFLVVAYLPRPHRVPADGEANGSKTAVEGFPWEIVGWVGVAYCPPLLLALLPSDCDAILSACPPLRVWR